MIFFFVNKKFINGKWSHYVEFSEKQHEVIFTNFSD